MKKLGLILWLCIYASSLWAQESDYNKSLRTYHENKLDSARLFIERALNTYRKFHKTDSLVLAYSQKTLVEWDATGIDKAFIVIDTAVSLTVQLAPKNIARVAAYSCLGQLYVRQAELNKAEEQFVLAEKAVDPHKPPNRHYVMLYNQIALMHLMAERYQDARRYAEKAYALNLKFEGKNGSLMPRIVQTLFYISNYSDRLQEALKFGAEFERLVKLNYPPGHPIYGTMHNSLAIIYETLQRYDDALYHRQLAVDIHLKNFKKSKNPFSLGAAYQNLGVLYGYIHEEYLAEQYLSKGSGLLAQTYGEDGAGMVNILVDLAVSKMQLQNYSESEKLFQRALTLQKLHDPGNWASLAYVESFFGDLYLEQNQYEKAAYFYKSSVANYKNAGAEDSKTALLTKEALAKTFSASGQLEKALLLQKDVLYKFKHIYPQGNNAIAGILQGISESYFTAGQLTQSLKYSNQVFAELMKVKKLPDLRNGWFSRLPFSYHTSEYVKHRVVVLQALHKKTGNKSFLRDVLLLTDQYSEFISGNLHLFRTQATLVDLADVNKGIYSSAVEACWKLSNIGKDKGMLVRAFGYSERGKALLLMLVTNNMLIDAQQGKKNNLAIRDRNFRSQLTALNLQYIDADHHDSLLVLVTAKMEQYRLFKDSLKKTGNKLLNAKQRLTPQGLELIRDKLLLQKQTIIEYTVTDESLFTFVLTAGTFHVNRTSRAVLKDVIALKDLHDLNAGKFAMPAYRLYQSLIKPIEPYFASKRLMIIPDADLYYLNFESLITNSRERDFSRMPYLIKKYNISYLLSAASAVQFKDMQRIAEKNKALLFAPVFTDEMKKSQLQTQAKSDDESTYRYLYRQPFALKAARKIGKYISGDLFVEQKAGESAFKKSAPGYRILHLGTHAQVNDQSPLQSRLFFARALPADTLDTEDGYLHAYEIYAMELKAELAVLTACETGSGQYRNGEGVISLAHSFMSAGCSSVVMSFWEIDDKTSASVITEFYRLLSKGHSKSEALRQAKLQYLNNSSAAMAHPYYWAGLALIGDDNTTYHGDYSWLWFVFLGIAIIFLFIYLGFKWINKSSVKRARNRT